MSNNTGNPGVPIIGQPVTILAVSLPVNATLRCNCGGAECVVVIVLSAPGTCPSCGKTYVIQSFNPATGQLSVGMTVPDLKGAS